MHGEPTILAKLVFCPNQPLNPVVVDVLRLYIAKFFHLLDSRMSAMDDAGTVANRSCPCDCAITMFAAVTLCACTMAAYHIMFMQILAAGVHTFCQYYYIYYVESIACYRYTLKPESRQSEYRTYHVHSTFFARLCCSPGRRANCEALLSGGPRCEKHSVHTYTRDSIEYTQCKRCRRSVPGPLFE